MTFVCRHLFALVLYAVLLSEVVVQRIDEEDSDRCITASTCGECIKISPLCAWCGAENFTRGEARCDILKNVQKKCPEKDISNPKLHNKTNRDDAWTSGGANISPVQVKPQELEFKLRPNEPVHFKLKFKQEENYPVDLYFLLDLSYGMVRQKEAQERLIELGKEMPESMMGITNNFKLGFGTFVDKILMPYTAWTEVMLQNRCPLSKVCRPPHDFKNHVGLRDDVSTFADKMKEALEDVSQSMDDAEGGLDGLIQALDCDVQIGWRNVSRRIIVYSSNSLFHLAGYGKLGGATRQSDLRCALNSDGLYEYDKIYDYPSVSQIASKLREKKANVIFAVMTNVTDHYQQLRSFLDGAIVGELADDSKNIVDLIRTKYYELRSRIIFQTNNADNVTVVFKSKCRGDTVKETASCDNLEIKTSVEFDVTLTVNSDLCKGRSGIVDRVVTLDAVGLNEQLNVKLKIQCDCDCEGPGHEEVNSDKCTHGNGTFECGMCNCNPDRYGRKCECDESQISSDMSLEQCKMDKNDTITCSGKGECICGVCNCLPLGVNPAQRYSGDYCQCNDYNCPVGSKGLCGGSTRGACRCGKCTCFEDWTGDDCECTTSTDTCLASNGKMCNDFGTCQCGRCICTQGTSMVGPTCEDCPTCSPQCSEYIDCAQCKTHGTGKHNKEECEMVCQSLQVDVVDTLDTTRTVRQCDGIDVDGCKFFFTYEYTPQNDVLIKAQKTKDCPEEAPVAAIVGGTVAAVVLIPLLIICLIIFIRNRRDAKEYADFMREKDRAKWDSGANPIYKDPKSTFQNPTYRGGRD